jgi:hypothetical protein
LLVPLCSNIIPKASKQFIKNIGMVKDIGISGWEKHLHLPDVPESLEG